MGRPRMGLHTRDEKEKAFGRARKAFERGLKDMRHAEAAGHTDFMPYWSIGYLEAIYDVAKDEKATDLSREIETMLNVLTGQTSMEELERQEAEEIAFEYGSRR